VKDRIDYRHIGVAFREHLTSTILEGNLGEKYGILAEDIAFHIQVGLKLSWKPNVLVVTKDRELEAASIVIRKMDEESIEVSMYLTDEQLGVIHAVWEGSQILKSRKR
jgi:hypothetical protein